MCPGLAEQSIRTCFCRCFKTW